MNTLKKSINSNATCSEHVLTDVKTGTLVQVKEKHRYFYYRSNPIYIGATTCVPKIDDIMIYLSSNKIDVDYSSNRWKVAWAFDFLHAEHGRIILYWDRNCAQEPDLCQILCLLTKEES